MNAQLTTERLVLRKFKETDAVALYEFLKDHDTVRFLPIFPLESVSQATSFLKEKLLASYQGSTEFYYAITLKTDDTVIGFVKACLSESYDFGYALKKEFWNNGIVSEAADAVLDELRLCGVPFVTATHDKENPASGGVMKKIGMCYCYSYIEHLQLKNITVIFRMYQLNLNCPTDYEYDEYKKCYPLFFDNVD